MSDKKNLENYLEQLGQYIQRKNQNVIPEKEEFFSLLEERLKNIEQNQKVIRVTKPISTTWDQFLYGKNRFIWYVPLVASILIFFGLGFYFNLKQNHPNEFQHQPVERFGGTMKYYNPHVEEIRDPFEKQLIEKIQLEEDPEKKLNLLRELIKYYEKTNQEEKIQRLLELID